MVLSVLFWNVAKNDGCIPSLVNLARTEQIDVLLLAEPMPDLARLLLELNGLGQGCYHEASAGQPVKVKVFTPATEKAMHLQGERQVRFWHLEGQRKWIATGRLGCLGPN